MTEFDVVPRWSDDSPRLTSLVRVAESLGDRLSRAAERIDHDGAFPGEEFAWLAQLGFLTAPLAPELGGAGLGWRCGGSGDRGAVGSLLRILEEVGRGNLAVGRLYEGHVNALLLIQQFGRPDQRAAWAADARAGRIFGVWNTQGADGVRFGPVDASGCVLLSGAKTFASGAGWITRPVITGLRADGLTQLAVVPTDEVEVAVDSSWWRASGMRATASQRVAFDGVRLDAGRSWCGEPGVYFREPWFSGGAIRFAAVQLGGARALFEAAVASLRELGRADDPYQRARVGTMAIALETGRQWLRAAAEVAERVPGDPDAGTTAATITHAQMTRTAIEGICQDILRLAEQCVGARGLLRPHPIERVGRDLTLYLRQPGPDSCLAQVGQAWLEGRPPGPYQSGPEPL